MCGIVGFIDRMDQNDKSKTLEEMMDTIAHRGPSSSGEFIDEGAAIGFRRLSIIDLEGGDQPIFNEDKTNYLALAHSHFTRDERKIAKNKHKNQ